MRRILRLGAAALAVAVIVAGGTVAGLAQDKEALLKERQTLMKQQGADAKAVSEYLQGKNDQATAQQKADDLVATSAKIPSLFAPGTSSTDFAGKTNAKPVIWQQWDHFKEIAAGLHSDAEKLSAAVKSGDKDAVKAQLGALGKNGCGACHDNFREKMS